METIIRAISLPGSPRRERFSRPDASCSLDFDFLDASTGLVDGIRFDPELSYLHTKRFLAPQEIGVYCSHLRAWKQLLDHPSAEQIIVLEDDVYADWGFIAQMASLDWNAAGFGFVKFFGRYPAKFHIIGWHVPMRDRHLIQYVTPQYGLQAYLVTRKVAEIFTRELGQVISRPIDVAMERPWATGVQVAGVVPSGVLELSVPSTIKNRVDNHFGSPRELTRYYLSRVVEHGRAKYYRYCGPRLKLPREWP